MPNTAEYNKRYYETNKEIYLEKRKEACYCSVCCSFHPKDYYGKHLRTKKHTTKCPSSYSLAPQ